MQNPNGYDVLIIGSGLGGLLCGVILAKEGKRVCILEKNKQVGGSLQTFVRDKVILDTGVHYIGGFGQGQSLRRYFDYVGIMNDLNIRALDPEGFDRISFDDDPHIYPHAQGYERFVERLCEFFPKERAGLLRYVQLLRSCCALFPMYSLNAQGKYPDNLDHLYLNARQVIDSLTQDPKLRAVLAGSNVVYAGNEHTPFYVHALVVNAYIESAHRCVDGGGQISKLLVRELRRYGGDIFKRAEVRRLVADESTGRISGVLLSDGMELSAQTFISNVHPVTTLRMLDERYLRKAYRERIYGLRETVSTFCVYMTFEPQTVPYLNYNIYHLCRPDPWNSMKHTPADWPLHYMLSMGANSKHPDYGDNLAFMGYMHYEEVVAWAHSHNTVAYPGGRPADYEAFKAQKAEIALREVERRLPGLRQKIKGVYTATPLSFRDYIGSPDGSLYGIERDCRDPMRTIVSPRTKIPNLYFTGQNSNLHGILGVTVGAFLTCFELLGKEYLLDKVLKG